MTQTGGQEEATRRYSVKYHGIEEDDIVLNIGAVATARRGSLSISGSDDRELLLGEVCPAQDIRVISHPLLWDQFTCQYCGLIWYWCYPTG